MTAPEVPALVVHEHATLKHLNFFAVEATAALLAELHSVVALPDLFAQIESRALPWLALGEGSNMLFIGDWPGAIVRPLLPGIAILDEDGDDVRIRVGAGENWHRLVVWCLQQDLFGLENLALIPGSVGAAPVQNIGAYGVELDRRVVAVEAYDRECADIVRLEPDQCRFDYRDSRFKRERGRWLITALELRLSRQPAPLLDYAGVRAELATTGIERPTPRQVFDAVCSIRRRKLPDPAVLGNAGSFFKNPIVPELQAQFIRDHQPDLPIWPTDEPGQVKLSAAWMIEHCGHKGRRLGAAGISEQHALVLVNHGGATGAELWALARLVRDDVEARLGITLEPEPRIVGAS